MEVKLIDIAEVIRSKNAGPFELTFDIIFKEWDMFHKVCEAKAITPQLIADLYSIPVDQVINVIEFKPAKAIKGTIVRKISSGQIGETDVYGAQQHAPLLDVVLNI